MMHAFVAQHLLMSHLLQAPLNDMHRLIMHRLLPTPLKLYTVKETLHLNKPFQH